MASENDRLTEPPSSVGLLDREAEAALDGPTASSAGKSWMHQQATRDVNPHSGQQDDTRPYRLLIGSHKGGTGQTTGALALAWTLAQQGLSVTLTDADPVQSATLVASGGDGTCGWPGVTLVPAQAEKLPAATETARGISSARAIEIVDGPALTERSTQHVLRYVDGILLTCLPDPLSLRTVPAAARAIETAQQQHGSLELVGILIALHDPTDELQDEMLSLLRQQYGDLLLEPPVPLDSALAEWPLDPGSELPAGPARLAYHQVAQRLVASLSAV